MAKNRNLTELKNIGEKLARRLNEIGIFSESDLRKVGAVKAHKKIKTKYPNETLPVCYYLYSFEGALIGKHWGKLSKNKKQELLKQIER